MTYSVYWYTVHVPKMLNNCYNKSSVFAILQDYKLDTQHRSRESRNLGEKNNLQYILSIYESSIGGGFIIHDCIHVHYLRDSEGV